jgi:hypothetical protein
LDDDPELPRDDVDLAELARGDLPRADEVFLLRLPPVLLPFDAPELRALLLEVVFDLLLPVREPEDREPEDRESEDRELEDDDRELGLLLRVLLLDFDGMNFLPLLIAMRLLAPQDAKIKRK